MTTPHIVSVNAVSGSKIASDPTPPSRDAFEGQVSFYSFHWILD